MHGLGLASLRHTFHMVFEGSSSCVEASWHAWYGAMLTGSRVQGFCLTVRYHAVDRRDCPHFLRTSTFWPNSLHAVELLVISHRDLVGVAL